MQRVVFENGHCLLPWQSTETDYIFLLDDDVRKIAGKFLQVHDTGICIPVTSGCDLDRHAGSIGGITLSLENLCGGFRGSDENGVSASSLIRHGAPRVGLYVKHRQFVGTHRLFHSVHGRFAYREKHKMWTFKGGRSLEDIVAFVRDITDDQESPIYPTVNMLSVTLRTDTSLVINPANSLMQRVLEKLYSNVVRIQPRVDDTNNLFFMDVVGWEQLLRIVTKDKNGSSDTDDMDVQAVRSYMALHANNVAAYPTASIGYTRKGVFFVRITFPCGCVCNVVGSRGTVDGVPGVVPDTVCVGGVEPFVHCVVNFICVVLVKMRVLGVY
jgi:hypothetical protein